ncbi:MAG: 50S ribosomal protein L11 [Candidatus Marsarchaeota archaeon]|jgi:large subunit ribosomal protein L11|nr:50S ribosomal protein L11 [Candidatus Marsarchaeota archaeon]MCL5115065.1 50S ribosomal protein L11 [Candidatus Marsarchaeota archaeon]
MPETTIKGMIEGGKATGGPPLGPALGPLGVPVNDVIKEINEKTKAFEGLKIAVMVIVDTATKKFRIEVGAPSTSALILKEIGAQSGAKTKDETVGNITVDQAKKIAAAKESSMYGRTLADRVKQVLGTCKSMGVKVENEDPKAVIAKINSGEIKIDA